MKHEKYISLAIEEAKLSNLYYTLGAVCVSGGFINKGYNESRTRLCKQNLVSSIHAEISALIPFIKKCNFKLNKLENINI
jgi:hypothetical protein